MTVPSPRSHLRSHARAPLVRLLLGSSFLLAVVEAVSSMRLSGPAAAVKFTTEANLTYGPAIAMILGALMARADVRLGDVFHAAGHRPSARFSYSLQNAAIFALATRAATVGGLVVGGIVQSSSTAGDLPKLSARTLAVGQVRIAAMYVLAAALGALAGWAARSTAASLGFVCAVTLPYTEFFGALANRARHVLDILPYAPFGALRATFSGNGGVFGDNSSHARYVDVHVAVVVLICWLLALAVPSMLRGRSAPLRALGPAVPVVASAVVAAVIGAAAPRALAASIPWQWQPSWRHAHDAGWDSRQVTLRWISALRGDAGSRLGDLYASPAPGTTVDPEIVAAVTAATSTAVRPQSRMRSPEVVVVSFAFAPPLSSGNVEVSGAELQLWFALTNGRWLITRVEGPHAAARVVR